MLDEEGYRYSSSIYPVRHDLYGDTSGSARSVSSAAGLNVARSTDDHCAMVPEETFRVRAAVIFACWPYAVSRLNMRRVNRAEQRSCVFYMHPWEIDPEQPRQEGISARTGFRHYTISERWRAAWRGC